MPKGRLAQQAPTAGDLVDRNFMRTERDRPWVTDITEHPTREGKVYRCVVLDTFSRRVVGWSIDSSPTASFVTNALSMAIGNRRATNETIVHSDHGTSGGIKWSSQHPEREESRWKSQVDVDEPSNRVAFEEPGGEVAAGAQLGDA